MTARKHVGRPLAEARRGRGWFGVTSALCLLGGASWWFSDRAPPAAEAPRSSSRDSRTARSANGAAFSQQTFVFPESPYAIDFANADEPELIRYLRRQLGADAEGREVLASLRLIAASRPALALELAQTLGRDEQQAAWVSGLAREWTARDAIAVWSWLQQQGEHLERFANGSLLDVVLQQMAADDPQQLVRRTDAYLSQPLKDGLAGQVVAHAAVQALLARDPDLACVLVEAWSRTAFAAEIGAGTFTEVARRLAESSLSDAFAWLDRLPASADRTTALGALAARAVAETPEEALRWAAALTTEADRAPVMQRAFTEWAEHDVVSAAGWLTQRMIQQKAGVETDQMIATLIHSSALIRVDPIAAVRWAEQIRDEAQRAVTLDQVFLRWASRDATAASLQIEQASSLTLVQKADLRRRIAEQQRAPDAAGEWFAADVFDAAPE